MTTGRVLTMFVSANLVFWAARTLESQGTPDYKVQVQAPLYGLRVQTDNPGGQVGSFGGHGDFTVDAPFIVGGRLMVKDGGNVGIGIPDPGQRLSVAGTVQSTAGGFMFPDGSVQATTAAKTAYSTVAAFPGISLPIVSPGINVLHLNVPTGTYVITATVELANVNTTGGLIPGPRSVSCTVPQDPARGDFGSLPFQYFFNVGDNATATMTMHWVLNLTSGSVDVACQVWALDTFGADVQARARRLTAVPIAGSLQVQ